MIERGKNKEDDRENKNERRLQREERGDKMAEKGKEGRPAGVTTQ